MELTEVFPVSEIDCEMLFRYQVVALVLTLELKGVTREDAVRKATNTPHHVLGVTTPRLVSKRSIYRWLELYEDRGLDGLAPKERGPLPTPSLVLPLDFLNFLVREKTIDPKASIPELIRLAGERGILAKDVVLDRTTVYRAAKRLNLPVEHRRTDKSRDMRRFSYPHRLDMVLCDGKHFRAGAARARRVALFFLDDATRFGLHVIVGTSENALLFLHGLFEVLCKYGFFSSFYLDHGPGFIALDTIAIIARLHCLLIHGEAAYPEGHGKIERFNRTAKNDVLRKLDGRPDVDPDCRALTLRLQHYLDTQYNARPHESLDKQTPYERFYADTKALLFPQDHETLRRQFQLTLERRVSPDNVVSIDHVAYEVPRGHVGEKVLLHKHVLEGNRIFVLHEGKRVELHPVDLVANARARRTKRQAQDDTQPVPSPSAADLAFQREYGPVVDADGGFTKPLTPPKEDA